jgi:hypothetical protein
MTTGAIFGLITLALRRVQHLTETFTWSQRKLERSEATNK